MQLPQCCALRNQQGLGTPARALSSRAGRTWGARWWTEEVLWEAEGGAICPGHRPEGVLLEGQPRWWPRMSQVRREARKHLRPGGFPDSESGASLL